MSDEGEYTVHSIVSILMPIKFYLFTLKRQNFCLINETLFDKTFNFWDELIAGKDHDNGKFVKDRDIMMYSRLENKSAYVKS